MIEAFEFETAPGRVVFGRGAFSRLSAEVDRLKVGRVLVLTPAGRSEQGHIAAATLGSHAAGVLAEAKMHTPVDFTERAMTVAAERQADALLAVGGGSTIGLGKAMALRSGLPLIAVPTTYSGSEMTDVVGETAEGVKTIKRDPRIRPKGVIYDVELTLSVSPKASAASAFNAMAHAVESLYAREPNPLTVLMAEEGVRAFASALPLIIKEPRDLAARSEALYGAWLCGCCLASSGMALHHKLCHVLGGLLGLPHAETHAIVLPYALDYNASSAPDAIVRLSRALGASDPATELQQLAAQCGLPIRLADIGMREDDLESAVDLASKSPYWNPRPIDRAGLLSLLRRAFTGAPPSAD
jgi:alcohol dehydrogenase class IV